MTTYRNDTGWAVLVEFCVDPDAWRDDPIHTDHSGHKTVLHEVQPSALFTWDHEETNDEDVLRAVTTMVEQ